MRAGLFFKDVDQVIGLHVNGPAGLVEDPCGQADTPPGRRARLWVVARVQEASIRCARQVEIPGSGAVRSGGTTEDERLLRPRAVMAGPAVTVRARRTG